MAIAAAVIAIVALLGWVFDVAWMKSVIPGEVAMKANTAVGLLLLASAMWAAVRRARIGRITNVMAIAASLLGLATLLENILHRDFGIDLLLFREAPGAVGAAVPGRMAASTAICLILFGPAVVLLHRRRWLVVAQSLAAATGMFALLEVLAFLYGARGATPSDPFTLMAMGTAAAFFLLSSGALAASSGGGFISLAVGDTSGSRLIRYLLPAAAGAIALVIAAVDLGEEGGIFGSDVGHGLIATAAILIVATATLTVARILNERERLQRTQEAELRSILRSAGDAIMVVDARGRVMMSNPRAEEMFGYGPGELQDMGVETLIPTPRREIHETLRKRFVEGEYGHRTNTSITGLRKNGAEFPGELTIAAVDLPASALTTVVIRDVTARKQAEEALRQSEARFRALVDQIPGVTLIEVEDAERPSGFRTEFVSPQIFDILGYTQEEWVSDPDIWTRIEHPDDQQALAEASDRALETGEPYRVDVRALDRSGETHWLRVESFRTGPEGDQRWYGLMTDITDRKLVESVTREKDAAVRAGEMKSEFLSRMSHELRTPLNAIIGFAQLLDMQELDDRSEESVDHILQAGRHLLGLVNEVLAISATQDAGRDLQPIDISAISNEAAGILRPEADDRRITVAVDGQRQVMCLADRSALSRVLFNLVSNAIKYNRDEGRVDVHVSRTGDGRARVEVRDTGHGIPADKIPRLFSPFDRLDAERTGVEGTGLGLTLSKSLVESMGGTLTVESREGEGSVFSIELAAP